MKIDTYKKYNIKLKNVEIHYDESDKENVVIVENINNKFYQKVVLLDVCNMVEVTEGLKKLIKILKGEDLEE